MSGLSKHIPGTKAHDKKKAEAQGYNNGSTGGLHDHSTAGDLSSYDTTTPFVTESAHSSSATGVAGSDGVWQAPGPNANASAGYNYSYPSQTHPSQYSPGNSGATATSRGVDTTYNNIPKTSPTHGNSPYNEPRRPGHDSYGTRGGYGESHSDSRATYQDIDSASYANRGGAFKGVRGNDQQDFARVDRYDDRGNYSSTAIHPPPPPPPPQDDHLLASSRMTQSTTTTTPSGYTTTTTTTPHTTRPQPDEREAVASAIEGGSTTTHAIGVIKGVQAKADRFKDVANRVADNAGERAANKKY